MRIVRYDFPRGLSLRLCIMISFIILSLDLATWSMMRLSVSILYTWLSLDNCWVIFSILENARQIFRELLCLVRIRNGSTVRTEVANIQTLEWLKRHILVASILIQKLTLMFSLLHQRKMWVRLILLSAAVRRGNFNEVCVALSVGMIVNGVLHHSLLLGRVVG